MKIKSSRKGEITQPLTNIDNHALVAIFLSQICLKLLFVKIKLSPKFPDLQYKP